MLACSAGDSLAGSSRFPQAVMEISAAGYGWAAAS